MITIPRPKTIKEKWLNAIQTVYRAYYKLDRDKPKPEKAFCDLVNKDCEKCILKTFGHPNAYYNAVLHPCFMHRLSYTSWPYVSPARKRAHMQFYKDLYKIVHEHDGRSMHKWTDPVVNLLIKRANDKAWYEWIKVTY